MTEQTREHAKEVHERFTVVYAHSDLLCDVTPKRKQGRTGDGYFQW